MINKRPLIKVEEFEEACQAAKLTSEEQRLLDYIRYKGIFNQPMVTKDLGIRSQPPVLTLICKICRKIGEKMPKHFDKVRQWSKQHNEFHIKWDGDLICSYVLNIDGEKLCPEERTAQFHTFTVHKELFEGLE